MEDSAPAMAALRRFLSALRNGIFCGTLILRVLGQCGYRRWSVLLLSDERMAIGSATLSALVEHKLGRQWRSAWCAPFTAVCILRCAPGKLAASGVLVAKAGSELRYDLSHAFTHGDYSQPSEYRFLNAGDSAMTQVAMSRFARCGPKLEYGS